MKLQLVLFSALLSICHSSFAQRELPFREIFWSGVGVSGFHQGERFEYFLLKRKVFAGLPIAQEKAVIQEWSREHPNAISVPVSVIGERSQLPIVYVWAVDGSDVLNVFLVRKGVHPAIGMLDTANFGRILEASPNAPFIRRGTSRTGRQSYRRFFTPTDSGTTIRCVYQRTNSR